MFTRSIQLVLASTLLFLAAAGCGTTKKRTATEQLLMSDAVDQAVASIDFRPLAGHTVYLDTTYLKTVKGFGFVNSEYIVSSIRQQMFAADCRLQDTRETADYVVEVRVGTLGTDANDIVYGLPQNTGLSSAASLVPNAPPLPAIPELSVAKKESEKGAAKIALFAYHRETNRPVWQSGITRSHSTAQEMWVLGAGPFQQGTIYDGTEFAGQKIRIPRIGRSDDDSRVSDVPYDEQVIFKLDDPNSKRRADEIMQSLEETIPEESDVQPVSWLTPIRPKVVTSLELRLETPPASEEEASDEPGDTTEPAEPGPIATPE